MAKSLKDSESAETCLQMNYWREELSDAQRNYYSRTEKDYNNVMLKVSEFISKEKGSIIEHGSDVVVLQASPGPPAMSVLNSLVTAPSQMFGTNHKSSVFSLQQPSSQTCSGLQAVPSQPIILQGTSVAASGPRVSKAAPGQTTAAIQTPQGTIQLVMDPRLGFIVGAALPSQHCSVASPVIEAAPVAAPSVSQQSVSKQPMSAQSAPVQSEVSWKRPAILSRPVNNISTVTTPSTQAKGSVPAVTTTLATPTATVVSSQKGSKKASSLLSSVPQIASMSNRPTENTSVGGLSAGTQLNRCDKEDISINSSGPDSREVSFNKLSGKTFPSLVVLARPHLRTKEMTPTKLNQERVQLDAKVKNVLMYMATKFTEWLIQQGLIKGEQHCNLHLGSEFEVPHKLKLGMYSDVSKFPFSGGYVWVSDCCPQRFVSVFSGSIFEGAPHPPSVLLKLVYHWCCQTNVQNVIQWVKVDNFYVKNFFTHMRSVCITAVHENHEKLGGPLRKVEVGVISLGTTSQDGNQRQVKVEVLGVMDVDSKLVRLRAVEPLQDGERNYKRRFVKILEPLKLWLHPESLILTDFTVDKGTLLNMGFSQVYQSTIPDPPSAANKLSNQNIMEYLRRIVPRMFQNTLSLLSRQIIQQFLDELVWRERWGPTPAQAFDSMMIHLASQTKLNTGENLIVKLAKIATNPFRNWEYQYWKCDGLPFPEPPAPSTPPSLTAIISNTPSSSAKTGPTVSSVIDLECYPTIAVTKPYEFKLYEDTENRVRKALQKLENGTSLRKAVDLFKVPRSVLMSRAKEILRLMVPNNAVFSDDEEKDITDHLMTLHNWGYPFSRWDIRLVVKQYLDACGRTEPRFKDNYPGDLWIERYLSRHPPIRHKMCRNLPARGNTIEPEAIKQYVMNLSTALQAVPPENILNFMEIGLTGDPLKSMTLELRELRYPVGRRKCKSSASVMLSCTALGKVLPSFVVFEGKPVVINKGHFPGEYYATKSGWFDEIAFDYWLETVVLPWADELVGKKVIISDNLVQLFTVKSLALCTDKEISVVCMPCNITGVLSPLDVALCDKLRVQWKAQTRCWASSHSDRFIQNEDYPNHIYDLLTTSLGNDIQEQIRKAFKVIGLYPYSSRHTMKALENGGVSLDEGEDQDKLHADPKKRKRIFIASDDPPGSKKLAREAPKVEEVTFDDDTDKEVTDIEKALQQSVDLVPLDSYYYGTTLPVKDLVDTEYKLENLNAKCPLCQANVCDNITLMRHLLGHSETPSAEEVVSVLFCKYCAMSFSTQEEYGSHVQVHSEMTSPNNACLICGTKLSSRAKLILHMHKTHNKMELPYICTICHYRSSEHYKLVDHFYEVHSKGERIQCPFCLKCVAISNVGKKMPANIFFFMHHVKKHQAKQNSRKCSKCALWFVHKGILNQHLTKDHSACDGEVVPYDVNIVTMPCPKLKTGVDLLPNIKPLVPKFSSIKSNNIKLRNCVPVFHCIECRTAIEGGSHFLDHMSCLKCSFATSCVASMQKHINMFHGTGRSMASVKSNVILLPQEMYCMCGFRTRDGDSLARHLIKCKKRVAFTNAACANTSSIECKQFGSLGSHVKCEESCGPSRMLNSLELIMEKSTAESFRRTTTANDASKSDPSARKRIMSVTESAENKVMLLQSQLKSETFNEIDCKAQATPTSVNS